MNIIHIFITKIIKSLIKNSLFKKICILYKMSYRTLSSIGNKIEEKLEILVPEIKTIEDKNTMVKSYKICLIDVHAEWCGPCKITAPEFAKMYKNYNLAGVVGLAKEDVELGLSPNVQVIPTFQFYVDGKFHSVITGADMINLENTLVKLIQDLISSNPEQPSK